MAEDEKVRLSLTQIVGAALAAMVAAVAASFLGVYGTIIGAALMSVISTAGAVLYEQTVHRSRDKLKDLRNRGDDSVRPGRLRGAWTRARARLGRPGWWKPVSIASLTIFAVALGAITVIELGIGKSLTSAVTGHQSSGGTSISAAVTGGGGDPEPIRSGYEERYGGPKRNEPGEARKRRHHESNPTGSTRQRQPDSGASGQERHEQSGTDGSGSDNAGRDNSGEQQQQKQSGAENSGEDTSSTSNQQAPDTTRTPAPNPMPGDGGESQQNQPDTRSTQGR